MVRDIFEKPQMSAIYLKWFKEIIWNDFKNEYLQE